VDLTIDQLFHVTTSLEERISLMEEQLMKDSQEVGLEDIVRLKQDLIRFRKVVIPLEGEIRKLLKDESNMIDENYSVFINDILDHVRQLDSSSGYFRETIMGLFELHQTNLANRMNQVMKVLTIIATIFIPLTFLAGIYGMNFTNMPELSWRWSYPILLMVMFLLGFGMFLWMKRRNWF
jgi:magnesium transporter